MRKRFLIAAIGVVLVLATVIAFYVGLGYNEPRYDDKSLSYWLYELNTTNYQARSRAAFAISKLGVDAVPRLIDALEQRPTVSEKVHRLLSERGPEVIASRLPKPLPAEVIQFNAALALAELGLAASNAAPSLLKYSVSTNMALASRSTFALGRIGPAAIPVLMGSARTNTAAKAKAISLISQMTVPGDDATMRAILTMALELLADHPGQFPLWRSLFLRFPDHSVPILTNYMTHPKLGTSARVNSILIDLEVMGVAVEPLISALESTDSALRALAIQSLNKAAGRSTNVVICLEQVAETGSELARLGAWSVLAKVKGDQKAVVAAAELSLNSQDVLTRHTAIAILGDAQSRPEVAVPILANLISSKEPEIRNSALSALRRFGSRASPAVRQLTALGTSASDDWTQQQVLTLLAEIGPPAKESLPLLKSLATNSLRVSYYARRAIAAISPSDAADFPVGYLDFSGSRPRPPVPVSEPPRK